MPLPRSDLVFFSFSFFSPKMFGLRWSLRLFGWGHKECPLQVGRPIMFGLRWSLRLFGWGHKECPLQVGRPIEQVLGEHSLS